MPIDKKHLAASPYRDRFLQEIAEHQEDANSNIGAPEELIHTFNMYVKNARQQKWIFATKVALVVLAFNLIGNALTTVLPVTMGMPLVMIERILYFPILLLYFLPLMKLGIVSVQTFESGNLTAGLAILGLSSIVLESLFWAAVITFFRYPPQKLVARFK